MLKDKKQGVRINDEIRADEIRVIDAEGTQLGVMTVSRALMKAEAAGLDLVEISPGSTPPVCRIMDYGKYLFEQSKQKSAAKKKQKVTQVKEIKLRPGTDVGDYNVKLRKMIEFLEEGDKVKISLRFRGRELSHQELGQEMLNRLEVDLEPHGVVESRPRLEGRQMVMIMAPKKKK